MLLLAQLEQNAIDNVDDTIRDINVASITLLPLTAMGVIDEKVFSFAAIATMSSHEGQSRRPQRARRERRRSTKCERNISLVRRVFNTTASTCRRHRCWSKESQVDLIGVKGTSKTSTDNSSRERGQLRVVDNVSCNGGYVGGSTTSRGSRQCLCGPPVVGKGYQQQQP
jgi:hypothetical protein